MAEKDAEDERIRKQTRARVVEVKAVAMVILILTGYSLQQSEQGQAWQSVVAAAEAAAVVVPSASRLALIKQF